MKKLTVLTILFFSIAIYQPVNAQININLTAQPAWGPVGYDRVDYYYLPDVDAYYSVPKRQFIYADGGKWVFANNLPPAYRGYNLYTGHKVVINEPNPYLRADAYRLKYANYKGGKGPKQVAIRDSKDQRYKNNGPRVGGHQDMGNNKNRGKGNIKVRDNRTRPIILRDKNDNDDDHDNNGKHKNKNGNGNGKNKGKGKG